VQAMNRSEPIRGKMRRFFHGSLSQRKSAQFNSVKTDGAVVCLIATPRRGPMTPIEQRLIGMLKNAGPIPFATLVKTAAKDLYIEELRQGAGVLDIGLFGEGLFNRDLVRELLSGDGVLWEIKQERESL
jgi:hypothetical protein